MDIAIGNTGKLCWRYNYYKRHGKTWDVEEVFYADYIIHIIGKLLCYSRQLLGFTDLGGVAAKSEETWSGE